MLRAAVGGVGILEGGVHFLGGLALPFLPAFVGSALLLAGLLILVGLLTPVACGIIALSNVGIALSRLPVTTEGFADGAMPYLFVALVAASVAFLGPGALSVDARLFGRREITIPSGPRNRQH